jgi:hypothetical protein
LFGISAITGASIYKRPLQPKKPGLGRVCGWLSICETTAIAEKTKELISNHYGNKCSKILSRQHTENKGLI